MYPSLTGVRQTLRTLLRSPGFTLSAVATLALGIAATTIIFSTYYHLIMRPLPYDDWQSLNYIFLERDEGRFAIQPSPELVRLARENATTLAGLEAWVPEERALTGRGEAEMVRGAKMTAGLPQLLGVQPLLGRVFTDAEAREDARVVLIGEQLWRTAFGAEPSVIGETVQLGPDGWTVIGVMPAHFARYEHTDRGRHEFWLPIRLEEVRWGLSSVARLRAGTSSEAVVAELTALQAGLPNGMTTMGSSDWVFGLKTAGELSTGRMNAKTILPRLFAAAALLLLISCANVAGLLLVRMHGRSRELAVRAAMGANRRRLLAELAVEQLALGSAAGIIGVALASWGLDGIRAFRPDSLAALDNVVVSLPVLGFAAATVLLTTLLFGALPALAVLRRDLTTSILAAGARFTSGSRTRSTLVTLQLALSTLLLVGGFLLVRTVQRLEQTDLGFDTANLLVAQIPLPEYRYDDASSRTLMEDLAAAVRELPGVTAASIASAAPPRMGLTFVEQLEVEGSDVSTAGINFLSGSSVAPGFFATIGARMIEGREFEAGDESGAVVVSRSFVDKFWPGESGVGRRFRTSPRARWQTITGVVADIKQEGPAHSLSELKMFYPMAYGTRDASIIIRTAGNPANFAPAVRQIVLSRDADLPIRDIGTMQRRMEGTIAAQRFNMLMLAGFAGAAVLLCGVGLYGLISYSLQQRVREVGVRVALGATPTAVRTLFMRQAVRLAAIGIPLGLAAAFASTKLMAAMVHGISPRDPVSFAAACLAITLIVLPAGWLPARRAARVQPMDALREQ